MTPGCSTICLPIRKDDYQDLIDDPKAFRAWLDRAFRAWLDRAFRDSPELFPEAFAQGHPLKDDRPSSKTGLRLRRVCCKATGRAFTVRPPFALPYLVGWTDDVEKALFLRRFGVPFWGLTYVFGTGPSYWYRLEVGLGRYSLVGTTVRRAAVPRGLVADEHHQTHHGDKVFIATVVAEGCCLGACVAGSCDEAALTRGCGVSRQEARDVEPGYAPQAVNTDGWQATRLAWSALFPLVAVLPCFPHGWLSLRDGCKKHPLFAALSGKAWHAYHALDRRTFRQRVRRLREWAGRTLSGEILTRTLRLCGRAGEYGRAYADPKGQRTSAMLDRVMRPMNAYFVGCQRLPGGDEARQSHTRAWALLHNFAPWSPQAQRANDGRRCPAERLNGHRYHDNWLHNLLVSASLAGYRH